MLNTSKPRLLIVYDYFYPAYKAGGPIQSLVNLSIALQDKFEIAVFTGAFDLHSGEPMKHLITNEWSSVKLPGQTTPIKVWYAGSHQPNLQTCKDLKKDFKPDAIYLNGIFSLRFLVFPLIAFKDTSIVICPRGMLQSGALAGKSFKKKIYLNALKFSGLFSKVSWHATNEEESNDIKKLAGNNAKVFVAGNLPKQPFSRFTPVAKKAGQLRLVYLSLIASKKNLLMAIRLLDKVKGEVSLDIYGPVKDKHYWEECLKAIGSSKASIRYNNDVRPEDVQNIFSQYDAGIFLTKGENFGHALYECLSVGRPIITSFFTAWNDLELKRSGWNVDISNDESVVEKINEIVRMPADIYDEFCEGALKEAKFYYQTADATVYLHNFLTKNNN